MRLPRQEQASRSMASTMRKPVLEGNRKESRAAVQKFTSMPTNYNQVGNAQAGAALAKNKVWDQVSNLGTQMSKIDYEQQRAALAAKKARLLEFATAYGTEVATTDLTQKEEGTLTSKYKRVGVDFQEALARRDEELNEEFDITDPRLKEEWKNIKIGIRSETSSYLAKLVDAAKDKESKNNAQTALISLNTKDEYEIWEAENGQWFDPVQLDGFKRAKYNEIEIKGIRRRLQNDPDFNSNVHIREYAEGEAERLANGELFEEGYNAILRDLEARRKKNINDASRERARSLNNDPLMQSNVRINGEINVLKQRYANNEIGDERFDRELKLLEAKRAETLADSRIAYYREVVNMTSAAEIAKARDSLLDQLNTKKISPEEFEGFRVDLDVRERQLLRESSNTSDEEIEKLRTNNQISKYRQEQRKLREEDKITPEEYLERMAQADRQEDENNRDALIDLNKADASAQHILTEYHISQGNVYDVNAARRSADAEVSKFHADEARKKVSEAQSLFENGDHDAALTKLSEIAGSIPELEMNRNEYESTMAHIRGVSENMDVDKLGDILDRESLLTTKLVEENYRLVSEQTDQNSKAAQFLAKRQKEMLENPEAYGITDGVGKVSAVNQRMAALQTVIDQFTAREEKATAERVVISERLRSTMAWGADPSLMSTYNFSDSQIEDKPAWAQEAFELYIERRQKETEADYGDPFNPGNLSERIPDVHTYAREFTLASGYAPPEYVKQLSEILNDPARVGPQASVAAAKNLIDLLLLNPGAKDQEGLEQSGFDTALAIALYIQKSGSANGAQEFVANLHQAQLNPAHAEDLRLLMKGTETGGELDQTYNMLRNQNPWMPENLDPGIRDHVAYIVGPLFNKVRSQPAAFYEALNIALSQWGAEPAFEADGDGGMNVVTKWKFMSIFRIHDAANQSMPKARDYDSGGGGFTSFIPFLPSGSTDGGFLPGPGAEYSKNNFVAMTIEDLASLNGYTAEDKVTTQWVGPSAMDPKYRNDERFKNGGWVLTNQAGMQLFDKGYFAATGVRVPIFIGMGDLSPKAAAAKDRFDSEQRYESAKGVYDEWQKYMGITNDSTKTWRAKAIDGVLRWFETNDKQKFDAVDEVPESAQELKTIGIWEDKAADSIPGSVEEASARQVIELLRSQPYRVGYLDSTIEPEERKQFQDLMIQNAIAVTEAWFTERAAKQVRDDAAGMTTMSVMGSGGRSDGSERRN